MRASLALGLERWRRGVYKDGAKLIYVANMGNVQGSQCSSAAPPPVLLLTHIFCHEPFVSSLPVLLLLWFLPHLLICVILLTIVLLLLSSSALDCISLNHYYAAGIVFPFVHLKTQDSTLSFDLMLSVLCFVFLFCCFTLCLFRIIVVFVLPRGDIDLRSHSTGSANSSYSLLWVRCFSIDWACRWRVIASLHFCSGGYRPPDNFPFQPCPNPSSRLFSCNYNNRNFATRNS